MITIRCVCGVQLQVQDEHAGRKVLCPRCQNVQDIPRPDSIVPTTEVLATPVAEQAAEEPPRQRRRRRENDHRREEELATTSSGKATAGMILGLLTFIVPVLLTLPALIMSILGLRDVKRGAGRVSGTGMAITGIVTGLLGNLSLIPIFMVTLQIQESVARKTTTDNLKRIALAMHSYNDAFHRLPPAAVYTQNGQPLLSWRVLLLPFLEEDNLYRQFKLDEPWDGPNNRQLLTRIPKVFASVRPGRTGDPTATHYQVLDGPNAVFNSSPNNGLSPYRPQQPGGRHVFSANSDVASIPRTFRDGTSNTILIVEAPDAVPWSKPGDVFYDRNLPLPKLAGLFSGGFHVAMADGMPRFVHARVSEFTLRNAIEPADGNPLGPDW